MSVQVFYVSDFAGEFGVTRPLGRKVAETLLRIAEGQEMTECNFSGVDVVTTPFMQEIATAMETLRGRAIYSCLSPDVSDVLTYVENRRRTSPTADSGGEANGDV